MYAICFRCALKLRAFNFNRSKYILTDKPIVDIIAAYIALYYISKKINISSRIHLIKYDISSIYYFKSPNMKKIVIII